MRNLKVLWTYLARHSFSLIAGIFVLLLISGISLTQPYLLRLIIDNLQKGQFEIAFCILIIGIGAVQLGLGFLQRWAINRTGHQIESEIRNDLFAKLQQLDRSYFSDTSIGNLIVHSTSDISVQRDFVVQGITNGFNSLFLGILALTLMFMQNWRLALIGLVFLPFLAISLSWLSRKMAPFYRSAQEQLGEVSNRAQEVFGGIRVVKAYTAEKKEIERYSAENGLLVNNSLKFIRWGVVIYPLVATVMNTITAVLLWVGGNEIAAGRLTIGQFVQFNAYLLLLAAPLSNLGNVINVGQQAITSMGRIQRVFLVKPLIADPAEADIPTPASVQQSRNVVEFKDVGLKLGNRWVLKEVSFGVEAGKTVAVVGSTGAGKSSLAALVGRVYDPSEGSVKLKGLDVRYLPLEELRREVCYVPQETVLFSLPLRENIAFGKEEASDPEVHRATELSRLAQDLPQIPGGLEAQIGERGVSMSGGQRQRTAIARALVPDSSVLILDDSLSSVDARTQNQIAANLRMLSEQGRTTLIVTQRLTLVREADWIVVLDQGHIVEQGVHHELMNQGGLYARMYRREVELGKNEWLDDIAFETETAEPKTLEPVIQMAATKTENNYPPAVTSEVKPAKRSLDEEEEDEDEIVRGDYKGPTLTRLLAYLKPYRKRVALILPVTIIVAFLEMAGPLLTKIAIDNYITPGRLEGLWVILLLFLGAALGIFVLRSFRGYIMQSLGQFIVRDLRIKLFSHLLYQSLSFFDRYPTGRLTSRLTSDMEAINDLVSQGASAVLADLAVLAVLIPTMLLLDWRLTLVILSVLPVLFVVTFVFRKIIRRAWRKARRRYSTLVGYMAENYSGMLTVQLFNRQRSNFRYFQELNNRYFQSNRFIVYANGFFLPFVTFLGSLANSLLLMVGGWLLMGKQGVTYGVLVAFLQYTDRTFQPIRDLAERYTLFQSASASCERIFGLLDQQSEIRDPEKPLPLVDATQARSDWSEVSFEKVTFGYKPDHKVIKDVSFTIKPGEKVAIVGATGAGKSSLIGLLSRNYDVHEGKITVNGVDIRQVEQADLRQHLALVLQDPLLFKGTIADNIRFGNPNLTDQQVRQAARHVGADSFIENLPGGYDYPLEERGSNISVGQRQLLSFARALAYNPQAILILDEATSSVDSESEAVIQEALKKLLDNRTALIIAHRLSTIKDVDRVIVMDKGKVVEMGSQEELLARRGWYYQLYLHQMAMVA
ncbi:MAG TPA: ABC transporter ATP-binding protein [Chloroflexia bacterium]|nr:ABC transporter ATP-binding protein [Chloroflexia bacterium]